MAPSQSWKIRIQTLSQCRLMNGTFYGEARLAYFEVWAFQVDPQQVSLDDPIDLDKHLDGTTTVRSS